MDDGSSKPRGSGKVGIYLLLAVALALRLVSLHYNQYIQGDVINFVTLTETLGEELSYSVPYRNNNYLSETPPLNDSYRETYAQHQPLWMFVGGAVYRYIYSGDAYTVLKWLSFLTGAIFLLLLAGVRTDPRMGLVLLLSSISIALTDYSANGSFYILCTLLYFGFYLAVLKTEDTTAGWRWAVWAGVLGAAALMTHLISVALIISLPLFFLLTRPAHKKRLLLVGGIMLASLAAFKLASSILIQPPINPSTVEFFMRNGLADRTLDEQNMRFVVSTNFSLSSLPVILNNIGSGLYRFLDDAWVVCGPLVIFLLVGMFKIVRGRRNKELGLCLSIILGQVLIMAIFPHNRFRFIVPIVPLLYFATAIGILEFQQMDKRRWLNPTRTVVAFIVLFGIYNLFYLVRFPHTYYYTSRPNTAREYNQMKVTSLWLRNNKEPGNVLGYSGRLDGGKETYLHHRFPFAVGRPFISYPHLLPRLVEKYDIRYIWTEPRIAQENDYLKDLPIVYQDDLFLILQIDGSA